MYNIIIIIITIMCFGYYPVIIPTIDLWCTYDRLRRQSKLSKSLVCCSSGHRIVVSPYTARCNMRDLRIQLEDNIIIYTTTEACVCVRVSDPQPSPSH